jgi:competence protein ComEC
MFVCCMAFSCTVNHKAAAAADESRPRTRASHRPLVVRRRRASCWGEAVAIPALSGLLLVAVFVTALGWFQLPGWLAVGGGVAATLVALRGRSGVVALASLGLALAMWGHLLIGTLQRPPPPAGRPGLARLTVEPLRTACAAQDCWAEARVLRCQDVDEGSCPPGAALVALTTPEELPCGARVDVLARLAERPDFRNPAFGSRWPDTRPVLRARALGRDAVRVREAGWATRALLWSRSRIRGRFEATLAAPHAGIARALLLGEGGAVEPALNDAIRAAGVSHVLAVSGMHVTVLVGGLAALVRALWLRTPLALHWEARRVAAGVGALLAPLVAALCGGSPSAVRAALTSTLMFALSALGQRPSALAVSALAVAVHIAIEPRAALHPGFVLSVAATAALLTAGCEGAPGLWRALRESLRAWLSTAPFLLLCFGGTSLVAMLANVVLLPLGALLIPLCVGHLLAALLGVSGWLGSGALFEVASGAFLGASRLCAALDPGLQVPALAPVQLLVLGAGAGFCLLPAARRLRAAVAAAALLIALLCELQLRSGAPPEQLQVVFLDVGQGDAAIVRSAGRTALIDAGGSVGGGPDPGLASVLPVLEALRVRKLDLVVLSHPHPDHFGGLSAVLAKLPVSELWDTGQAEAEGVGQAARLLAQVRAAGGKVRGPSALCGGVRELGRALIDVLAPCPGFDEGYGANDNSFVVRLRHGRRSFLFTGDVEQAAEQALVARYGARLRSDVLKVPHHGSRTSSTDALLRAVSPWLAVVSAGRGNRFGHPHADVIARLARQARHTLRTDVAGGVEVIGDGETLRVRAWDRAVALASPD